MYTNELKADLSTCGREAHWVADTDKTLTGILGNEEVDSLFVVGVPHQLLVRFGMLHDKTHDCDAQASCNRIPYSYLGTAHG